MKLLFDLLPLLMFFGSYKYAKAHEEWASSFATQYLGGIVSGGVVGPKEAPMVLATVVIILVTCLQVAYLLARGRKVDTMLWVVLLLAIVFGGATIWFHDPTFIKWKFSIVNWAMGLAFWLGPVLFGANLLKKMMGEQIRLPDPIWHRLNLAWVVFFMVIGALNIYFAYNFSENTWLDIKFYGGLGATLLFTVAQGFYMSKHVLPDAQEAVVKQS